MLRKLLSSVQDTPVEISGVPQRQPHCLQEWLHTEESDDGLHQVGTRVILKQIAGSIDEDLLEL